MGAATVTSGRPWLPVPGTTSQPGPLRLGVWGVPSRQRRPPWVHLSHLGDRVPRGEGGVGGGECWRVAGPGGSGAVPRQQRVMGGLLHSSTLPFTGARGR